MKCQNLFSVKKSISKCHLLKFLPRVLSANQTPHKVVIQIIIILNCPQTYMLLVLVSMALLTSTHENLFKNYKYEKYQLF